MTKTLNFSTVEILPSLLDKSKVQAISKEKEVDVLDKAQITWKKELHNKYYVFCMECGQVFYKCPHKWLKGSFFGDGLGKVKITELFQITVFHNLVYKNGIRLSPSQVKKLARLNGLKSTKDLFDYLDKIYDLSKTIPLWVTRWKWLK